MKNIFHQNFHTVAKGDWELLTICFLLENRKQKPAASLWLEEDADMAAAWRLFEPSLKRWLEYTNSPMDARKLPSQACSAVERVLGSQTCRWNCISLCQWHNSEHKLWPLKICCNVKSEVIFLILHPISSRPKHFPHLAVPDFNLLQLSVTYLFCFASGFYKRAKVCDWTKYSLKGQFIN